MDKILEFMKKCFGDPDGWMSNTYFFKHPFMASVRPWSPFRTKIILYLCYLLWRMVSFPIVAVAVAISGVVQSAAMLVIVVPYRMCVMAWDEVSMTWRVSKWLVKREPEPHGGDE